MLTRRGRASLVVALVLLVAGRVLGITELFGLAVAIAVVVAIGALRVRSPRLRVSTSALVIPPVVSVGEHAALELTIENTGLVPTPHSRLRLVRAGSSRRASTGRSGLGAGAGSGPTVEIPRLVPGERASVSLSVPTSRRGRHEIIGYDAMLSDALGTARRRLTGSGPARYAVRPIIEDLPGTVPAGGAGSGLETTRSAAERLRTGASLLRPYVGGDDLRRVHWATTARVGDLMVREGGDRERDASSGATVVLSPLLAYRGPRDAKVEAEIAERFEDAVRVTASLLKAAEPEGSFRLVIPGDADTGEGSGGRHLETALDVLTDARPLGFARGVVAGIASAPASALGERVVHFVGVASDPDDLAMLFGASPEDLAPASAAVVVIGVGAAEPNVERIGRRHVLVQVPPGMPLRALWEAGDQAVAWA